MSWLPKKNVVVPVDFSEPSFDAIQVALEHVDDANSVHVLHVLPLLETMEPAVVWTTLDDEERRRRTLKELEERLNERNLQGMRTEVLFGNPGRAVADYAEEVEAELVVIPSHGHTGLKHFFLGSVAERVARLSPCPVLVLRRKE